MRFPRSCGTLLHPTSLPSPYGIGDFGPEARQFLQFLKETGQTIWQVLPLTPVSFGNSPYTSWSAFAGNPYLISPHHLMEKGLLHSSELQTAQIKATTRADYPYAYKIKDRLFRLAGRRFYESLDAEGEDRLESFQKENRYWLDDYALFIVLAGKNQNRPWNRWRQELARRKPSELGSFRKEYREEVRYEIWLQFEFYQQWMSLKQTANEMGIRLIGDIPVFVDHNSADVWAHSSLFSLDESGEKVWVSGVPPDYFSESGQLWGNPLYRWDRLREDGYQWWIERFRQMFHMYDAIRVDHFRGFESFWQVQAGETTAKNGKWVKGPGADFFTVIEEKLGRLPIIAEDLGVITPEVEKLRDRFGFPGMKILQFAFENNPQNSFLPHNYHPNSVVYSGTHDNDTTLGWFRSAPASVQHEMRVYTRSDGREPSWELIRLGMMSVADQAIFPLQDFLELDSGHRMNIPGTAKGNWGWRYTSDMLAAADRRRIREWVHSSNRKVVQR